MEEAKRLASIEKVGNIMVGETFDLERLADLLNQFEKCKESGIFETEEELSDYEGFVNTVTKIVLVREAIKDVTVNDAVLH
jgi:hypothetical protein